MENTYVPNKVSKTCDRFVETFLADETDALIHLLADDCVWTIMATGECLIGTNKIKKLLDQSVVARKQTKEARLQFLNKFVGEKQFCLEFIHYAVVLDQWPKVVSRPDSGTIDEINSCIVCRINKEGMIDRIHEYFDLSEAKVARQLYS
ncbi:MAG: hypothetical protein ABI315_06360 [Bacteroidia bacterium]